MPDDQANGGQPVVDAGQANGGQSGGEGAGTPAVETFKIDGQEYTADQVKKFIKDSTDYGQFQPVFTQQQQILKDPNRLKEYVAKTYPDLIPSQQPPVQQNGLAPEMQEAFRILKEEGKFMTQEEAQTMAKKLVEDSLAQREADQYIRDEMAALGKEWDGQNGKPKFDFEAVRQHALKMGFPNLTTAFKDLNESTLREYYASQKVKPNTPTIARPGAQGIPVGKEKGPNLNEMGAVKKDAIEFFGGEE